MPELPEVETLASSVKRACEGAKLDSIEVFRKDILSPLSDENPAWYAKAKVGKVYRHGKTLLFSFQKDKQERVLGVRLGMSGQLLKRCLGEPKQVHTHAAIRFLDRDFEFHYVDARRFGKLFLLKKPDSLMKGIDALKISPKDFVALLAKRTGRIKALLMHQGIIAGVGNIYATEALFASRIHPYQQPNELSEKQLLSLYKAMRKFLLASIRRGGTTIRDFLSLDGNIGTNQKSLKVYGKKGLPCPQCKTLIQALRPGPKAQAAYYCPKCQRM